jgi:hypothetical protein
MRKLDTAGNPEELAAPKIAVTLHQHLPYRLQLLLDGASRVPARSMADNQAFEAGAVAGRSLLAFLGVDYDKKLGILKAAHSYHPEKGGLTDEVKAPDVGGRFVEISSLSDDQKELLIRFIHGVHKACAHFTLDSQHGLDVGTFQAAAGLIAYLYWKSMNPGEQVVAHQPA